MKTSRSLPTILFTIPVSAMGLFVLASSILRLDLNNIDPWFWLMALSAACLGMLAGLKTPGRDENIPLFYLFVFIGLAVAGPDAVILMTGLAALCASVRRYRTALPILFNTAAPVLSIFAAQSALRLYTGTPADFTLTYNLLIALCLVCAIQSALHSVFASLSAHDGAGEQEAASSALDYARTFVAYFALAAAAGFLVKLTTTFNLPTTMAASALGCAASFVYLLLLAFKGERVAEPSGQEQQEQPPQPKVYDAAMVQESEELFRGAFEYAPIAAALITPKGQCLRANKSLCELLNYSDEEIQSSSFQRFVHPDDLTKFQASISQLLKGETDLCQLEKRFINKEGNEVWSVCDISSVRAGLSTAEYFVIQLQDITKRRQSEEALLHNAFHDPLTSLPNRVLFIDHLKLAINRTHRSEGQIYAVLFIDLDRFKIINDSLGHLIGDHLLINIARRLETCVRPGDTIARVGGDEFTILLEDLQEESEAVSIAHRILNELSSPFVIEGREVFTTVSIGIAPSLPVYESPTEILRDADTAMYRAKLMGKNRYEIFDKAMHEVAVDLLQMETDLRHALERGEFYIQYQPIVSLDNFRLRGFEALVRWRHPERGLISPLDFIPVAEDTGQIIAIGQWVLGEACRQIHQWQSQYGIEEPMFISVNLSGKQFEQPDLIEQIKGVISETRINPRSLKLEITESMVMENVDTATGMLHQLRDLGVQLSIDDFGTGYSSLSYLHRFPIDTLKIDRSFVIKMIDNNENIEIVRTIIMLAQNLGMDVIAEGVETREQLMLLRKLKCENGQGYYFSKPLETKDAENLLSDIRAEGNPFKKTKPPKAEPVINTRVKSIKLAVGDAL